MASFVTNRGKYRMAQMAFNNGTRPTNYYAALVTISSTPTVDTNTWSEVSANEAANYTQVTLANGATAFPNLTENDSTNVATVNVGASSEIAFTASGNCSAAWVVITDDNATPANRDIVMVLDLGGTQSVTTGQQIKATNTLLTLT